MSELDLYISLFITFFKIGLFGFGGGYAMLSLIQHDVVETHNWISVADFTDIVAISQSTPGPIAFNTATYIGYTATGSIWGSAICTIAVSLPSLIIMITISKFFFMFRDNKYVEMAMQGLKITVLGLIGAAALLLMNKQNFVDYKSYIIFAIAFIATFKFKMDPILMKSIGVEFVRRFASTNINKIITVEASGIAPAIMVGYLLELPVVFAKKKKPSTMDNMLITSVYSFTKQRSYDVCVSKDFLTPGDQVLFIDDFLANGNAAKGIMDLVKQAGAELVGMGFIIEKAFQHGGDELRSQGIHVESLAIIESLDNCEIKIR